MFRFGYGLAVQLENEFRMTGAEKLRLHVLVTRDAGVGADIKRTQIAHACADSGGVGPIGAGVTAQPTLTGAVTVFAGDAFVGVRRRSQTRC